MESDILVGCLREGYNEKRNFLYLDDMHGVHWVDCGDRLSALHKIWHKISGKGYSSLLHSVAWPKKRRGCHLVHGFNAIQLGTHRWVVTYETSIPRLGGLPDSIVRWAWRELAKQRCQAILALSNCAEKRFIAELNGATQKDSRVPGISTAVVEAIKQKLQVLHPPQSVLLDESAKVALGLFEPNEPLRLAIVGHDFYRKGGLEVLMAVDALVSAGKDIVLSIAGQMTAGDYASRAGENEIAMAEEIIKRLSDRVCRLGSIPSQQVLSVLARSHLLCLPTWGETYGYSVLEGQASACAAITTDIRALPEINDDSCGWIIPVPKLENGDADIDTVSKRSRFRSLLAQRLIGALREAHDNRDLLRRKAAASVDRIRRNHDPIVHAERLLEIYRKV